MTDDKLFTSLSANTIMAQVTNHVQRTRLITSSTDKRYSLDSEHDFRLGCRNVTNISSFQNYTHPDDHTTRTTDTTGFKPFTRLCFCFLSFRLDWEHSPNLRVPHNIAKTLNFFFNSLLGVWKCYTFSRQVFDGKYQTWKTVFEYISKRREESWKYDA